MNPCQQFGRLWCCHYTNETSGWKYGSQTHTCSATNCRAAVTLMTTCFTAGTGPVFEFGNGHKSVRGNHNRMTAVFWLRSRESNSKSLAYEASVVSVPLRSIWWTTRGSNPPSQVCKTRVTPLRLLAHFWCPTRVSNPQETDFESVMSAVCINRTSIQMRQSRFCSSGNCFRVPRHMTVPPTSFRLSSVLVLRTGLEPAPFGLEDRCTSCCAYGAYLVTLQGIEP